MKTDTATDRRKNSRVSIDVQVEIMTGGKKRIPAETEDVSLGGILLRAEQSLEGEREFILNLYLANVAGGPIRRIGKVAHNRGENRVGIQFVDINPAAERALREYLAYRVQKIQTDQDKRP